MDTSRETKYNKWSSHHLYKLYRYLRSVGMKRYFKFRASATQSYGEHSGLVSVIVILDRVLRATNFW